MSNAKNPVRTSNHRKVWLRIFIQLVGPTTEYGREDDCSASAAYHGRYIRHLNICPSMDA